MNNILSITVGATLEHGTCAKNVQQFVLRMSRNEQNLEHNIINLHPIFETTIQM